MRLGIDAMGGDYAPRAVVEGAVEASKLVSEGTTIVLYGDKQQIETIFSEFDGVPHNVEIIATSEVIEMKDHPTQAFQVKKDSSIVVGFTDLKMGKVDAFASAGSTGAMMVGCMFVVKQIEGIIRPTIATTLPTTKKTEVLLLDVGLNIDCKPEVLQQYGLLGSIYAKAMLDIENPRVGLVNIGEESTKGNAQTKATYDLMKDVQSYNFVGNVEPKTLFLGKYADVFVCDGFVGNLMLKQAESMYTALTELGLTEEDNCLMTGINYENTGGTPVLGVNGCVIVGHGCSTKKAIKNMILQTEKCVKSQFVSKIKEALKS
ncbi:MAG: phosphate acyltransferase PlsX [Rikenellaceae bacterium]